MSNQLAIKLAWNTRHVTGIINNNQFEGYVGTNSTVPISTKINHLVFTNQFFFNKFSIETHVDSGYLTIKDCQFKTARST